MNGKEYSRKKIIITSVSLISLLLLTSTRADFDVTTELVASVENVRGLLIYYGRKPLPPCGKNDDVTQVRLKIYIHFPTIKSELPKIVLCNRMKFSLLSL